MRFEAKDGLTALRNGLFGFGLLALTAGGAAAQLHFDGNVIYQCNIANNTLAGQFVGAPSAGSDSTTCPTGYDALTLGTVTFTHNLFADPLLPTAVYKANVVPNFQPAAGSPAYFHSVVVPDPWFMQTTYAGAIGPGVRAADWTQGWTYYDSTGANRHDLHLASNGDPDPRPIAQYHNINLYSNQTWSADSSYLVFGFLRVKSQATLRIPAGVVIFEDKATLGTVVVERGAKIYAIGDKDHPIIITSSDPPGSMQPGSGGGIYLCGYAKTNLVNSCIGDSAAAEGGAIGFYGGNDNHDNSGTLRYVRVEYAGKEVTPNNELNTFTFCGCGDGTTLDHLEAFESVDDHFEFFGGAANIRYAIGIDGRDDGYDTQLGYQGKGQFLICRQWAGKSPAGDQNGDKGIECDNNEYEYTANRCAGHTIMWAVNCTFIGDHRSGPTWPGPSSAVNLRNGAILGGAVNCICYDFKTAALKVDVNETWRNHCLDIPFGRRAVRKRHHGRSGRVGQAVHRAQLSESVPRPARCVVRAAVGGTRPRGDLLGDRSAHPDDRGLGHAGRAAHVDLERRPLDAERRVLLQGSHRQPAVIRKDHADRLTSDRTPCDPAGCGPSRLRPAAEAVVVPPGGTAPRSLEVESDGPRSTD